ncbi:MAG TPA: autotransporter outer membrane beta-barrel domain-containing protein [Stenotrophomonas sp.]|jgi:autotransporter family porin
MSPMHPFRPALRPLAAALLLAMPPLASAATTFTVGRDMNLGSDLAGTFEVGGTFNQSSGTFTVQGPSNAGAMALGGTLAFDPNGGFKTVTVRGDFEGGNGRLAFNTVLANDDSATDQLVVGGATRGTTRVTVANAGGPGAQTRNGIQLVQVGGASDGVFALDGRVVAGAYEYKLYKGGTATPDDGDWYLRSQATGGSKPTPRPSTPAQPVAPVAPVAPVQGGGVRPAPALGEQVYRPEGGAYAANQAAALGLFQHQMHDRSGEADFAAADGKQIAPAVWTRVQRRQIDGNAGLGQLDLSTDASLLQVGGELVTVTAAGQRFHFGAMAGAGRADSHIGSRESGYRAKGKVDAYSVGLYGSWFGSADNQAGPYADAWLQYGSYDNKVRGEQLAEEKYDADSWQASMEGGWTFAIPAGDKLELFIEPQAQVIYTDYSADDHVEANGTQVAASESGQLTTRVGVRMFGHSGESGYNLMQPFVVLNWWHNDKDNVVRLDANEVTLDLPRDRYEAKVGVQAQLGSGWTGWANAAYTTGSEDYRDVGGQLGLNYRW